MWEIVGKLFKTPSIPPLSDSLFQQYIYLIINILIPHSPTNRRVVHKLVEAEGNEIRISAEIKLILII